MAEYKLKPEASAVMLKKLGYQGNSMQADEVNAFLAVSYTHLTLPTILLV